MAPGPWIKVPENPKYFENRELLGLVECQGIDESGGKQGRFLGDIIEQRALPKGHAILVQVLGSSDRDYMEWVQDQGSEPLWYHLSVAPTSKAKPMTIKKGVIAHPLVALRQLDAETDDHLGIDWLPRRSMALQKVKKYVDGNWKKV